MKLFLKSKALLLFSIILISTGVLAQDIPDPMVPFRLVNDFAGVFSSAENSALEQKLLAYNDSTSTQIYVVTVNDLGGYAVSDYAFRLGEEWAIGQKSKDNGAVILIKPKVGNSRGQAFIATGYGLEARINDAYAGRIVRNEMIPYFIEDDYFGGVNAAVDVMIARLSGEYIAENKDEGGGFPALFLIIGMMAIIVLVIIIAGKGNNNNGGDGSGHHRTNMPPIFFPPRSGRSSGGFGSGGFGGGGFGGRGFGGGGGGRFGGGGAGGSW